MDTEVKIKDELKEAKDVFLSQDIILKQDISNVYSLEDMFGKSKKNRNYLFIILICGFLLSMVLSGFITHTIMKKKGQQVQIDIGEFEDLKLKEMLYSIGDFDNRLNVVKYDIVDIKRDFEDNKEKISAEYDRLKSGILATDYLPEESEKLLNNLEEQKQEKLKEIEDLFRKSLNEKNIELEKINKKINSQNNWISKQPDSNSEIQNPEQNLQELKIKSLHLYYNNKIKSLINKYKKEKQALFLTYNPYFNEKDIQEIIRKPVEKLPRPPVLSGFYRTNLINEEIVSFEKLNALDKKIFDQMLMISRMKSIPFNNSPQRVVLHLESSTRSIMSDYAGIMEKMAYMLQNRDSLINSYGYFLQHLVSMNVENGYIIDPRDETGIIVFMDDALEIKQGDKGLVFRKDDEFIAVIDFIKSDGRLIARAENIIKEQSIKPFDKILLKK